MFESLKFTTQGIFHQAERPLASEDACVVESVPVEQHRFLKVVKQIFINQTAIHRQFKHQTFGHKMRQRDE
jgi:hypothetical protein